MRELKFDLIYGIVGNIETYFDRQFNFGEIEQGFHFDEISDSPLLRNYEIIAKRLYTGQRDKNGIKIYEGDILDQRMFPEDTPNPFVVVFEDGAFRKQYSGWDNNLPKPILTKHEIAILSDAVIGNIYQNPELLK